MFFLHLSLASIFSFPLSSSLFLTLSITSTFLNFPLFLVSILFVLPISFVFLGAISFSYQSMAYILIDYYYYYLHFEQYQSPSGSSWSNKFKHFKWNDLGQLSQHIRSPPSLHLLHISLFSCFTFLFPPLLLWLWSFNWIELSCDT